MGGTPAQRMGWDPQKDVRYLAFAFAFDFRVRHRACSVHGAQADKATADEEFNATEQATADEWLKKATPEEVAALKKMAGVT